MKRPAKQPQKPLTLVQLRRVVPWGISAATLRWFVPAFADGYPATLLSNAGGAGRCAVVGGKSGLECWECTAPRLVRLLENHKQDIPAMLHRAAKMVAGSPFADGVDGWSYCRGLGVWGFTGELEPALKRFQRLPPDKLVSTLAGALEFLDIPLPVVAKN